MAKKACIFKRLQKGYKSFLSNLHKFNTLFVFDIYKKNGYNSINLGKGHGNRLEFVKKLLQFLLSGLHGYYRRQYETTDSKRKNEQGAFPN